MSSPARSSKPSRPTATPDETSVPSRPDDLRAPPRPRAVFTTGGQGESRTPMTKGTNMKAVVWHGVGEIAMDEVADPVRSDPADAVVRITGSAICGTDLHFVRGTMPGMRPGTILGHEAVGVVEEA